MTRTALTSFVAVALLVVLNAGCGSDEWSQAQADGPTSEPADQPAERQDQQATGQVLTKTLRLEAEDLSGEQPDAQTKTYLALRRTIGFRDPTGWPAESDIRALREFFPGVPANSWERFVQELNGQTAPLPDAAAGATATVLPDDWDQTYKAGAATALAEAAQLVGAEESSVWHLVHILSQPVVSADNNHALTLVGTQSFACVSPAQAPATECTWETTAQRATLYHLNRFEGVWTLAHRQRLWPGD